MTGIGFNNPLTEKAVDNEMSLQLFFHRSTNPCSPIMYKTKIASRDTHTAAK